jgi:hypothetical protein
MPLVTSGTTIAIPQTMADDETVELNRLRNRVLYQGYMNPIVEWTLSDRWTTPPGFLHIRYEAVKRYVTNTARVVKLCAEGQGTTPMVAGEIECTH